VAGNDDCICRDCNCLLGIINSFGEKEKEVNKILIEVLHCG
jgi:hypothetical protein